MRLETQPGIRTSDLVQFSSDAAFAIDAELRVVGWNNAAQNLLGYSLGEAIGKKCSDILQAVYPSGEPLCSMLCAGRSCFLGGDKWAMDACRIRHRDGSMVSVGISTLVIPTEARDPHDGEAIAVVFLRRPGGLDDGQGAIVRQPLRVFVLGQFCLAVTGNGLSVDKWKRKQAATLMKCLVTQSGRPVHRERLIDWLWPDADPERGWERLKVTMHYLRRQLRTGGVPNDAIETIGKAYLLRSDMVWIDAHEFEESVSEGWSALNAGDAVRALERFTEAKKLYRGDYMEDEPYADWGAEERERLREFYLEMLTGMAAGHASLGNYLEASQICRTALFRDPCRESFVRGLLENLMRMGRPDWARAQYETWRLMLAKDYGLEPTPETLRVHQRLDDVTPPE